METFKYFYEWQLWNKNMKIRFNVFPLISGALVVVMSLALSLIIFSGSDSCSEEEEEDSHEKSLDEDKPA